MTEFIDYCLEQVFADGSTRYGSDYAGPTLEPGWYCGLQSGMSDDGPDGPFPTIADALSHLIARFAAEYHPPIALVAHCGRLYRTTDPQPQEANP